MTLPDSCKIKERLDLTLVMFYGSFSKQELFDIAVEQILNAGNDPYQVFSCEKRRKMDRFNQNQLAKKRSRKPAPQEVVPCQNPA